MLGGGKSSPLLSQDPIRDTFGQATLPEVAKDEGEQLFMIWMAGTEIERIEANTLIRMSFEFSDLDGALVPWYS